MLEAFCREPILFPGKDMCLTRNEIACLTDRYCGYQGILEVLHSISEVCVVGQFPLDYFVVMVLP